MVMTEEKKGVDFSSIEVMARLAEVDIDAREICEKWLLITYDIPHDEKGDKARREFLLNAKMIGATRHTDSVYLMPWTPTAESIALELAKFGEVCVWTSQTTDEKKAQEITKNYDAGLQPQLDVISERLDKINENINLERYGRATKMAEKTEGMLDAMEQAILRRGSAQLYIYLTILKRRFDELKSSI